MKKLYIYPIMLTLILFACGGGGNGASPEPPAPISALEYDIFSSPPANVSGTVIERDGNVNNPYDDYVLIQRDSEGIMFTYRDVSNLSLLGTGALSLRSFHIATGVGNDPSDFQTSQAGDYLRAEKTTTENLNHRTESGEIVGTFTETNILEVGGKQLGLQYSDFGMWKTKTAFSGTVDGATVNQALMHEPENFTEKMSGSNNRAYFTASTGTATFTGNAMGVVREYDITANDDLAAPGAEIYGDAGLTVDLAGRSAALSLNFTNFYNFTFSGLEVERDGEFEELGTSQLTWVSNNNNTGIDFETGVTARFDVEGQFYGATPTNPTEAVGEAEITQRKSNGKIVEVDIAFGVKN